MRKTTGLSLLLLVFLSLCLIIFSLLSLSGAAADERLSQKTADRTKEYYAAVSEANQILDRIDHILAEEFLHAKTVPQSEIIYFNNCFQTLQSHFPDCVLDNENTFTLTFSVPITDSQVLQITLSVIYPVSPEDPLYQITGWNVRNTDTWTPDLSQNVFIP